LVRFTMERRRHAAGVASLWPTSWHVFVQTTNCPLWDQGHGPCEFPNAKFPDTPPPPPVIVCRSQAHRVPELPLRTSHGHDDHPSRTISSSPSRPTMTLPHMLPARPTRTYRAPWPLGSSVVFTALCFGVSATSPSLAPDGASPNCCASNR
jgi:hypothetical protein